MTFGEKLRNLRQSRFLSQQKLADAIGNFTNAIAPFTEGFGDGFVGFLQTITGISLEAFTYNLENISDELHGRTK